MGNCEEKSPPSKTEGRAPAPFIPLGSRTMAHAEKVIANERIAARSWRRNATIESEAYEAKVKSPTRKNREWGTQIRFKH